MMIIKKVFRILVFSSLILSCKLCHGQVFNWAKQYPMTYAAGGPYLLKTNNYLFFGGTIWGDLDLDSIKIRTPNYWSYFARTDAAKKLIGLNYLVDQE